ncbi:MAG: UDP-GlcNAc--UDP-phosphate GlcNAc-1-phosphate transferase [Bacteroidetes bacterium]|nr:UDP-GlcNAc--UDP-phosphate GlcNAc-1-phosphate transferase [Bacteroidota bacterium]
MDISSKIIAIIPLQILAIVAYLSIAKRLNLYDNPNERSSHKEKVIRGGGVIIPVSLILYSLFFGLHHFFIMGVLLVAIISFVDDIIHINAFIRLAIHFIAVSFVFMDIHREINYSPIIVILVSILAVAAVNAYNFMDGINGMTGLYTLTVYESIFFYNYYFTPLFDTNLLIILSIAIVIFLFFNLRSQAKMFSGDVGSISLGLLAVFYVLYLIVHTQSLIYLSLLAVYGVEAGMTVLLRLFKKQNIFQAHRMHLFQDLVNIVGIPHIKVSLFYSLIQLFINFGIFLCIKCKFSGYLYFTYITLILIAIYVIVKFYIHNNLEKYNHAKN